MQIAGHLVETAARLYGPFMTADEAADWASDELDALQPKWNIVPSYNADREVSR
jgi:hypothetical protein